MKVVIQNGSKHCLSRKDVEAMIRLFPSSWFNLVNTTVLYGGREPNVYTIYSPKEKIVGLFCPISTTSCVQKAIAIEELLLTFATISEYGSSSVHLSDIARASLLEPFAILKAECLELVSNHKSI